MMPSNLEEAEVKKCATKFAKDFFVLQYQLCTTDTLDSTHGRTLPPVNILPFCKMDPIKPGSRKIYQIEVPRECIPNNILQRVRGRPYKGDEDGKVRQFASSPFKNIRTDFDRNTMSLP